MKLSEFRAKFSHSNSLQACFVVLWSFLLLAPFIYRCGAGEADCGSMVAGIYQGGLQGSLINNSLYYFQPGQPLYNIGFATLVWISGMSFDSLLLLLNLIAALSTAVTAGSLYYLCRSLKVPLFSAGLGTLVYLASPYTFELATYAHPQTMSIALIVTSFCFLVPLLQNSVEGRIRRASYAVAAVLLSTSGLLIRMDGIVLIPLLWGALIIGRVPWIRLLIFGFGFPFAFSVGALAIRSLLLDSSASSGSLSLLQSLIKFMETGILDGVPRLFITLGTGGVVMVCTGFIVALFKNDKRAFIAAAVAVIPVIIYSCQNAHVPRRFVHVFPLAGFGVAICFQALEQYRSVFTPRIQSNNVQKTTDRSTSRRKAKNTKPVNVYTDRSAKSFAIISAFVVIIGNWFFWPTLGYLGKVAGDPFPQTMVWNALTNFFPVRHADQQKYYCWSKKANKEIVEKLAEPHSLVGIWLHYGELLCGYSRHRIPVSMELLPQEKGRPQITLVKANNLTHYYFGPPWEISPRQQTDKVLLLDNYGSDVTAGMKNIAKVAAPAPLKYQIW